MVEWSQPLSLQTFHCHSSFSRGEPGSKKGAVLCHWLSSLPLRDEAVLLLEVLQVHWNKIQSGSQVTRQVLLVLG